MTASASRYDRYLDVEGCDKLPARSSSSSRSSISWSTMPVRHGVRISTNSGERLDKVMNLNVKSISS